MKNYPISFAQKLHRILRSVVRVTAHKHDPLLINSLTAFNFRPPIVLEFPGERLGRRGAFSQ
jgi:hypothetical protein